MTAARPNDVLDRWDRDHILHPATDVAAHAEPIVAKAHGYQFTEPPHSS